MLDESSDVNYINDGKEKSIQKILYVLNNSPQTPHDKGDYTVCI